MIPLLTNTVVLLFTFYALARIVDLYFVESLEIISKKIKLSSDVAGATFMAIGSSAPELFVSALALLRPEDQQAIGSGTIVGSAIFNILVIIGASALYRRALLTWQPVIRDLIFYIIAILLLLFTFIDGEITFIESVIYVVFYVSYILSFKWWRKVFPYETKADIDQEIINEAEQKKQKTENTKLTLSNFFDKLLKYFFFNLEKRPKFFIANFLISIVFIAGFSHIMVESAVHVAQIIGIPEVVIGLTILAAGTSVPDLLSSINVAKKGKGDMAIANAVGSNVFDIAIGLGIPWLILTFITGKSIVVVTENLESSIVLLFSTVIALLFILTMKKWEIGRYAGILLISAYIFYVLTQIGIVSFSFCLNLGGSFCWAM